MGLETDINHEGHEMVKVAAWVWKDINTGRFCYEDETNNFIGDYETPEEASSALEAYCAHLYGGSRA